MFKFQRTHMIMLISLMIVLVATIAVMRYLETYGIFFPGKATEQTPTMLGMDYDDIYVNTTDKERINAWFVKAKEKNPTIIYAHGNAGTMSDRLLKIKFFNNLGFNVMIFDYRGYGNSTGTPDEQGIYTDGLAVYDNMVARPDVDPNRIIIYGASLGGIVAVDIASKRPAAALIVDSSITSAKESARIFYPYLPTILMKVKFDSIGKIQHIKTPKLIIHSPDDRTIPYQMGVRLYDAASEPKTFLKSTGGHNEIQMASDKQTTAAFKEFLAQLNLL